MSHNKLINYYLLCSISNERPAHMLGTLVRGQLEEILTKKEQELFLKRQHGRIIANETVIGGEDLALDTDMMPIISANVGRSAPGPALILLRE